MLRNSKNLNSSRSFQSTDLKINRVITSNITVILKPERSFYDDLFKRYRLHRLTNILTHILTNEYPYTMLILCFLNSPDPKPCKSVRNRKLKICTIIKVPLTIVRWELIFLKI